MISDSSICPNDRGRRLQRSTYTIGTGRAFPDHLYEVSIDSDIEWLVKAIEEFLTLGLIAHNSRPFQERSISHDYTSFEPARLLLLDRRNATLRAKQSQVTEGDWTCSEVMETSGVLRSSCYTGRRIRVYGVEGERNHAAAPYYLGVASKETHRDRPNGSYYFDFVPITPRAKKQRACQVPIVGYQTPRFWTAATERRFECLICMLSHRSHDTVLPAES